MAEKEAKYDLPDFFRKLKIALFRKSHISVKNYLFDLKFWLQKFLGMGYRIDIVRYEFEI
jgi:hypothetical protein